MKLLLAATAAVAALSAIPASATTYVANASYTPSSSTSGQFTFGSYASGTFTAFPVGNPCLFDNTTCLTSGNYLGVYQSADGLYHDSGTANIPASGLVLHPGQNGELSVIQFTAPTTASYAISFSAYQADDRPQTQTVGFIVGGTPTTLATLSTSRPNFSTSSTIALAANQTYSVFVGDDVDYFFDATGVNFSVTAVPELATWAMMLAGFAMIGAGARYRKRATAVMRAA